jgi:hypothetical protein
MITLRTLCMLATGMKSGWYALRLVLAQYLGRGECVMRCDIPTMLFLLLQAAKDLDQRTAQRHLEKERMDLSMRVP